MNPLILKNNLKMAISSHFSHKNNLGIRGKDIEILSTKFNFPQGDL